MDRWLEEFAKTAFQRSSDTAHDLKTPLNIAVLNLELLRMRVRKLLPGDEDPKVTAYAAAVDFELRRLARIFDAYFVYTTPPGSAQPPSLKDVAMIFREEAGRTGVDLDESLTASITADEKRMRDLARMLFEGCESIFGPNFEVAHDSAAGNYRVRCHGHPAAGQLELSTVFKFHYTDSSGNPQLSLATARLIAETHGGRLLGTIREEDVELELTLPLGER